MSSGDAAQLRSILNAIETQASVIAELLELVKMLDAKVDVMTLAIPDQKVGGKGTKLGKDRGNTVIDGDDVKSEKAHSYNKKNYFNSLYKETEGKDAIFKIIKSIPGIKEKDDLAPYKTISAANPDKGVECYRHITDSSYNEKFFARLREYYDAKQNETDDDDVDEDIEPLPVSTPVIKKPLKKAAISDDEPEVKKPTIKKPLKKTVISDDEAEVKKPPIKKLLKKAAISDDEPEVKKPSIKKLVKPVIKSKLKKIPVNSDVDTDKDEDDHDPDI